MRTPPPPPPPGSLLSLLIQQRSLTNMGSMKNSLISTQKEANASIDVIVMTTKHSDGGAERETNIEKYKAEEPLHCGPDRTAEH